ncbi:Hypothetical predicted protein [Octopus vulgaris]|uniref:Reverse transcriptase domain-containing protein n=1 Tax=Octopus vulgaris TaxID=6645 RepID=A0AA36F1Y4_OCTVU|nr:Hypothetical predicted protein [Octopus vulgaris]
MKPSKAPGPDNIPFEFFTHGGPEMRNHLMLLILNIWENKTLPNDFRDATITTIYKKGDGEDCNNYRNLSLLSIASKIFARILFNHLCILAEDVLPESQYNFRPYRGTIVMIFPSRTADGLQMTADLYNAAYERFGMQVNIKDQVPDPTCTKPEQYEH